MRRNLEVVKMLNSDEVVCVDAIGRTRILHTSQKLRKGMTVVTENDIILSSTSSKEEVKEYYV